MNNKIQWVISLIIFYAYNVRANPQIFPDNGALVGYSLVAVKRLSIKRPKRIFLGADDSVTTVERAIK